MKCNFTKNARDSGERNDYFRGMKYRKLRLDELEELEKEFVQFLSANTVTGDDWEKIKKEDPERAEGLIALFSDIVFDKTLDNIKHLEHRTATELRCFECQEEKIVMFGMVVSGTKTFSFKEEMPAEEMIKRVKAEGGKIQVFTAEKKYKPERKAELFRMMENGCLISKGHLFSVLKSLQEN